MINKNRANITGSKIRKKRKASALDVDGCCTAFNTFSPAHDYEIKEGDINFCRRELPGIPISKDMINGR
jgi:hypothetical protein